MDLVEERFGDHFGDLSTFGWPVTREQALQALDDFVDNALPDFGDYQDAMRGGEDFLFHALLSPCLNLGLLEPGEVCEAVLEAHADGRAPLAATEGFIRQVLGWREFVRGLYWLKMPDYADTNFLEASRPLPSFYWTGETDMNCIRQCVLQTRDEAYAHHIQRLMVTGNFALLAGVDPHQVHEWYLAVYIDAVEWVEAPNTIGMSQYADGGWLASKPYVASGRYIARMSNYCDGCRFDPGKASGADACPFTTLYWDFLQRHRKRFERHPRTALQWKNLQRLDKAELRSIADRAAALRARLA